MKVFCKGCGHELSEPIEQYDAFESMHWFCFHYAFEHFQDDPETPCDSRHCPTWQLEILKNALKKLGHDPEQIIEDEVTREWSNSAKT